MKNKLGELNPTKLIEDILRSSRRKESPEKREKKDVFLENLKKTSVSNFIENNKNKTLKEIRVEFERKLEEYNTATVLYCDKKNKESYIA